MKTELLMNNVVLLISTTLTAFILFRVLYINEKPYTNRELDNVGTENNGAGVSAIHIDWNNVHNFKPNEFQGQLDLLDKNVIYAIQKLRNIIGRIRVSPAKGAIARPNIKSKNSMHFAGLDNGIDRISLAIDFEPLDVDLKTAYEAAQSIPEIGAVGVYPDWRLPGLHIDLRKRKSDYTIAKWAGINDATGKQVYVDINQVIT